MKAFIGLSVVAWLSFGNGTLVKAEDFSIASFNLNNFRVMTGETRRARSEASRRWVVDAIAFAGPDIIGMQELGSKQALASLQRDLAVRGAEYPYRVFLPAPDQEIHCGILSRFPIQSDRSDTDVPFLLYGRKYQVLRGIMEVDVILPGSTVLTVFNVHLKSQLPSWIADERDFRLAEAVELGKRVQRRLRSGDEAWIAVLGDFNDHPTSRTMKMVLGTGKRRLRDTRPSEPSSVPSGASGKRRATGIAWTHYFEREDSYSRFDYVLISRGLERVWVQDESSIPEFRAWSLASDHRLIEATFELPDG